jgi:threonyl-tRNA synthetase
MPSRSENTPVVGNSEAEADSVAVRLRSGEDLKAKTLDQFLGIAREAIAARI